MLAKSFILIVIMIAVGVYLCQASYGEAFSTKGSPLSIPSPNLAQAFQFRLGSRERVDAAVAQLAK